MPLLSLDLNSPSQNKAPAKSPSPGRDLWLTCNVSRGWLPRRGLLFSLLVHEVAIVGLMFIPPLSGSRPRVWREKQWEITMIPKDVLYLPQLGGGTKGGSAAKAGGEASPQPKSPAPAAGARGATYAGKQQIVSNPPNPTNHIQTILQPDLPNPPILKAFVPLPNMVIIAQALPLPPPPRSVMPPRPLPPSPVVPPRPAAQPVETPAATAKPPAPIVRVPEVKLEGPQSVEAPQLTLPATPPAFTSPILPQAPAPPAPTPSAPPKPAPETKPAPARAPQVLPVGASKNAHNLLVLSPVSAPPGTSPQIPQGEARGQFTISPQANPDRSLAGVGSAAGTNTAGAVSMGSSPGAAVGNGPGNGTGGPGASGQGSGNGGVDEGKGGSDVGGGGHGGGGSGGGVGLGSGPGAGHGTEAGRGTGTGAGVGPGAGPFAGMTIQGGEGPTGAITIPPPSKPPAEVQEGASYDITIISTGNSGGGVGDFGVFHDEAVFTVYLNPATAADDPASPWPLQYAVLDAAGVALQDLLPPSPVKKQAPVWPPDLFARYSGQEIVVYAIIDTDGKMRHLKALQSPNAHLSEALLAALEQWLFRPATMNGKPVAVKAVLGVPVSSVR